MKSARIVAALSVLVALAACSDAETPKSGYDGGPVVDAGNFADSGAGVGGANEPCAPNLLCDDATLACVLAPGGNDGTCRTLCDRTDPGDPCGHAFRCGGLDNDAGACLPAGLLDEDCPCDDELQCIVLSGGNQCKLRCDPSEDAGVRTLPDAGFLPDGGGPADGGVPADAGFNGQGCPPFLHCAPLTLPDGGLSQDEGACLQ